MHEDDASTSQQTPHNTNSDNIKSVKRDYVKCRWLKKSETKSERNDRQRPWVVEDNHLYKLVKVEVFDCPNCHTSYDSLNRLDLKRNRAVSAIIEVMTKNEDYTQMY